MTDPTPAQIEQAKAMAMKLAKNLTECSFMSEAAEDISKVLDLPRLIADAEAWRAIPDLAPEDKEALGKVAFEAYGAAGLRWEHLEEAKLEKTTWIAVARAVRLVVMKQAAKQFKQSHASPSNSPSQWNIETTSDGVRVCYGGHHRSADCEWAYFVCSDKIDSLRARVAELEKRHEIIRDYVLSGRGPLEATLDNDQTNGAAKEAKP